MTHRRVNKPSALLLAFLVMVLAGCALPESGPQVIVTRVPLDMSAVNAGETTGVKLASAIPGDDIAQAGQIGAGAVVTGSLQLGQPLTGTGQLGANAAVTGSLQSGQLVSGTQTEDMPPHVATVAPPVDPSVRPLQLTHNILLIGTDQRELGAVGRTDTIMVLALDEPNGRAALISFPRDTYLPIPGVGYSRINTAYGFGEERKPGGGLALLASTIEKNFGIPIDSYVRIDFSGFQDVIDALGGVDVTVDCELYDELIYRYFGTWTLPAGEYHMNGEQALYYARSRKTTNDFDRARRQQRVLLALRKRVLDANMIPRVPALWMALRDTVDTDLKVGDITDLAKLGATMTGKDLYGMVIRYPLVTDWVTPQGGQVQLPDLPGINRALDNIWNRAPLQQTNDEEKLCP